MLERAGFGAQFIHRTGHSLGTEVHGNGVHMDDYETHDERRLIPGTGFTIEPGVYTKDFGVRTEINMFIGEREATVTGPAADRIRSLSSGTEAGITRSLMSTRKTLGLLHRPHRGRRRMAVGMVIASRLDLAPTSSAQTVTVPVGQQRAADRPDRRDDLPQHRQGRTRAAVVNIQTEVRAARPRPDANTSAAAAAAATTCCGGSSAAATSRTPAPRGRNRGQRPQQTSAGDARAPAPASSSTRPGFILTNNHVIEGAETIRVSFEDEAAPKRSRRRSSATTC